jgi:hypothetical protein
MMGSAMRDFLHRNPMFLLMENTTLPVKCYSMSNMMVIRRRWNRMPITFYTHTSTVSLVAKVEGGPGPLPQRPSQAKFLPLSDLDSLGKTRFPPHRVKRTCSKADLLNAVFCTLEFTTQKNGVCGKVIGLAPSGHPLLCPCRALARRIIHFRRFNISFDKLIASYFNGKLVHVKPANITTTLRNAVALFDSHRLGFLPVYVSACSMRAAGAMALLCANVDSNVIRLLGRWRSDECYAI